MPYVKSGIYVRAINAEGKWDSVDVMDLDEESFRIFVLRMMVNQRVPVGIQDEMDEMKYAELHARKQLSYPGRAPELKPDGMANA